MNFQWYPGHMTKTLRMMQEDIKLIDLVIEILDARAPYSSHNPDIDKLAKNKSRLILLNKADLADENSSRKWSEYFRQKGYYVVTINAKNKTGFKAIQNEIQKACSQKVARDLKRGIKNRPIRAMVVGIPNVGKSTFINSYAGKACTKTGNKPGVTRGKQWVKLNRSVELLDTPGILWPKFEDQKVGLMLAFIGSIKDEILNVEELAIELIKYLTANYSGILSDRYDVDEDGTEVQILEKIAIRRNCLQKGSEVDYLKTANIILEEFRSGKIGKITLELPM